jgi:hypothetical protein
MRPVTRTSALVASAALVVVSLTACNTSTATCTNGSCDVTLGGKGSSITLKTNQVRAPYGSVIVVFEGASGGSATLNIHGQTGTCTQGQSIALAQLSITCASVKDAEVKFTVTAG